MRRADLVTAAVLVLLGLVAIFRLIPRYVGAGIPGDDLPPAFMPYVAAVLGTAAAALLFATRLRAATSAPEPASFAQRDFAFIAAAAGVFAVAFVLMSRLGYLAGAAAIVAGCAALARMRPAAAVLATIALPAALWLLLERLLGFPLP